MKNSNPSNQALWKTRILKIIETPACGATSSFDGTFFSNFAHCCSRQFFLQTASPNLLISEIVGPGRFSATSHFSRTSSNLANCRFGGLLFVNLYMVVVDKVFANCGNLLATSCTG